MLFEDGAGTRGLLEERLGRRYAELDVRLSLNSNDALIAAVQNGLGITFLPESSALIWTKLQSVRAIEVNGVDLQRELAAVTRAASRNRKRPPSSWNSSEPTSAPIRIRDSC